MHKQQLSKRMHSEKRTIIFCGKEYTFSEINVILPERLEKQIFSDSPYHFVAKACKKSPFYHDYHPTKEFLCMCITLMFSWAHQEDVEAVCFKV